MSKEKTWNFKRAAAVTTAAGLAIIAGGEASLTGNGNGSALNVTHTKPGQSIQVAEGSTYLCVTPGSNVPNQGNIGIFDAQHNGGGGWEPSGKLSAVTFTVTDPGVTFYSAQPAECIEMGINGVKPDPTTVRRDLRQLQSDYPQLTPTDPLDISGFA